MAKRKTLMGDIHEELRRDRALQARFQRELTRMEQNTSRGYTVATLARIAAAVGARLEVRFVPRWRRVHA